MKLFFFLSVLTFALACQATSTSTKKTLPVNKIETAMKNQQTAPKVETKKEEDCDEKAKKPIEIKEETISLTGNTGCSLDEVKP
jgi:heat shock protein HslJ